MKTLSIAAIAVVLLIAGCKKESANTSTKTYLLSKITYNLTHVDGSKSTYVDTYTYDSKNRITTLNSQYVGLNITYSYNSNNTLSVANWYYPDGTLEFTHKYSYSGNQVVDSTFTGGAFIDILNLTLSASGQVQSYSNYIDNETTSFTCTYDKSGNITNFNIGGGLNFDYTYDDKKNPLSMIGTNNIDMMYFLLSLPQTNVNNPLTANSYTYAYTYNSAGFPVSANAVDNDPMDPISYTATFEYITN
jgi:hypothetical protein